MALLKKLIQHPVIRWSVAILWTIVLSIILLQPEQHPIIPTGVQPAPPSLKREIIFTSLHLLTFTITAWIWCYALNIKMEMRGTMIVLGLILLTYGLIIEYLQSTVPGRTAQWWDMLANCIGILGGWFLWRFFQYYQALAQNAPIRRIFG